MDHGLIDRGRVDHGPQLWRRSVPFKKVGGKAKTCVTCVEDRYCIIGTLFKIPGVRIRNDLHTNGLRCCTE